MPNEKSAVVTKVTEKPKFVCKYRGVVIEEHPDFEKVDVDMVTVVRRKNMPKTNHISSGPWTFAMPNEIDEFEVPVQAAGIIVHHGNFMHKVKVGKK